MKKEFVLPYGVKVNDGVLYFGDHQVSCYDKPYKFSDVSKMCTKFAIRYTNSNTSHPTLCTTLDIVLAEEGGDAKPLVWLCGVRITQGKHLPSGYIFPFYILRFTFQWTALRFKRVSSPPFILINNKLIILLCP